VYLGREGAAAWIAWCLLRRDEVVLGESMREKGEWGLKSTPMGLLVLSNYASHSYIRSKSRTASEGIRKARQVA